MKTPLAPRFAIARPRVIISRDPAQRAPARRALTIRVLATVLALGATGTFFTGCAATRTSKSTGEYIDDAAITAKLKAAYVRDPVVKALEVNVITYKGIVQLSGFVDSMDQVMRAEQIARNTPGVLGVQNHLELKTNLRPAPATPR